MLRVIPPAKKVLCMEQTNPYSLIRVPMGTSNAYLISANDTVLLVDAGNEGRIRDMEVALKKNGLEFSDIAIIIVTHSHYDHVGCLAEIKEKSEAKVLAHRYEADFLTRGCTPFPEGTMICSKVINRIGGLFLSDRARYAPVDPDIIVNGECELVIPGSEVTILPTPGHTSGSVSVIINNECAFVGDTLFSVIPGTVYPPFANDEEALLKSWEELLSTGCRTFYPGHGRPFSRETLEKCFEKKKT